MKKNYLELYKSIRERVILQKLIKLLSKKVIRNQNKNGRDTAKKKKFNDYSRNHQTRERKELKEECQTTIAFQRIDNFIATKVQVLNSTKRLMLLMIQN